MKILAIDTSTKFLCLGVYSDNRIYEYNLEVGRKLSVLLSPSIKRVLDTLELRLSDIDYFACGLGPGSFTGMRVGLATIKGLSWATKKPLIGIPTLDMLARGISDDSRRDIIPIIDAKRNLIYCSAFNKRNGRLERMKPYMLLNEKEFFRIAKPGSIILGDAINLYREKLIKNIKGARIIEKDYWYPRAHNIITLALERIKLKRFSAPTNINPIYLYPKECQIRKL